MRPRQLIWYFGEYRRTYGLAYATATAAGYTKSLARQWMVKGQRGPRHVLGKQPEVHVPGAPANWPHTLTAISQFYDVESGSSPSSEELSRWTVRLEAMSLRLGSPTSAGDATVLIPAYEQIRRVFACIESIFTWPGATSLRIIVVDDASPSTRFDALEALPRVSVFRNAENLGYIRSVNQAATNVSTPVLVTLNQDTLVGPGWLDELVSCLEANANVALAVPRILAPDFSLSEAGGVLWADGSAWNAGRGSSPTDSRCNYARDVDYGSGCCLAIRKSSWNEVGGLDEDFAPAYCDDSDLALRLRSRGKRVRYVPSSVVIHSEGTSMGRDENDPTQIKSVQIPNMTRLKLKHSGYLDQHTDTAMTRLTLSHAPAKPIVVCFHAHVPNPLKDAGSVDTHLTMQYLNDLGFLVVAAFPDEPSETQTAGWRANGIACTWMRDEHFPEWMKHSSALVTFQISAAPYFAALRKHLGPAPHIHHTGDVATLRLETRNEAASERALKGLAASWHYGLPTDPSKMWALERDWFNSCDVVLFVSQNDLDFAVSHGVTSTPMLFSIFRGLPDEQRSTTEPVSQPVLGFIGSMRHSPNPDAVDYFLDEIWPLIRKESPHASLEIWGSGIPGNLVAQWNDMPGVSVRGWFKSEQEVLGRLRLLVAPLRFGAGVKTKVVSACAAGVPVVGTDIAFQGLEPIGEELRLALNNPRDFAERCIGLLQDDDEWSRVSSAEINLISDRYSVTSERERLKGFMECLGLPVQPQGQNTRSGFAGLR